MYYLVQRLVSSNITEKNIEMTEIFVDSRSIDRNQVLKKIIQPCTLYKL